MDSGAGGDDGEGTLRGGGESNWVGNEGLDEGFFGYENYEADGDTRFAFGTSNPSPSIGHTSATPLFSPSAPSPDSLNPNLKLNVNLSLYGPPLASGGGELRIYNILALAVLESKQKFDLDAAINFFRNAVYVPEQFPALRVEVEGPLTKTLYTISLFEGGRVQSTGGCMPREAGLCMKQIGRRLAQKMGAEVTFRNFEIHNLLGVVDLKCRIDLQKLKALGPGHIDYEPSKFPALRISLPVSRGVGDATGGDFDLPDASAIDPLAAHFGADASSTTTASAAAAPNRGGGAGGGSAGGGSVQASASSLAGTSLTGTASSIATNRSVGLGSQAKRRAEARLAQKEKKRKVETITASIFGNGKINFIGGKSVKSIISILNDLRPFIEACT